MKNQRQYGILTNKNVKELFEAINERPLCEKCRSDRKDFQENDSRKGEDGGKYLGIILPGFSSPEVSPLDIMIIADSIGGGRKGDFRPEKNIPLEEAVHYLGDYYLHDKIATFHQYQMRKLFDWLERDFKKNWIFTDLVKCFVYQGREQVNGKDGKANMKKAIGYCSQYLDDQIKKLNPRIILILGSRVASNYCNLRGSQLGQLIHGGRYRYSRDDRQRDIIYSVFPSMRTADIWVKNIDSLNDDPWFPVKKALTNFFSNMPQLQQ